MPSKSRKAPKWYAIQAAQHNFHELPEERGEHHARVVGLEVGPLWCVGLPQSCDTGCRIAKNVLHNIAKRARINRGMFDRH